MIDLRWLTATRRFARALFTPVLFGLLVSGPLQAAEGLNPGDEDRIVQRAKQEVMEELHKSDFLKKEIAAGIQDYIDKQREAEKKARLEQERKANEKAKNVRRVSIKRDHIFGNPNAEVSLIEYSDFECPFCKHFYSTPKQVVKDYGGRVNWVYRHFPLPFHNPGSEKESEASECAAELGGNKAFWSYADDIYARTTSNGHGFAIDKLVPLAGEIGLDKKAFKKCLDSGKYKARVKEDLDEGAKIGVDGTPATILLNNKTGETRLISGALPIDQVKEQVDEILK